VFVACRVIKVDGKEVKPGEEVPGFTSWNEVAKRANLNLGWVKEVSESILPIDPPPPAITEPETILSTEPAKEKAKPKAKKAQSKRKPARAKKPEVAPLQPQE